ncbi:CPBP family intramembrane glutamic endopeptidase [Polaribacter sp. Q13]|uniref:CPBP family intramembrane glutamic endopeptidase n=1 Tax=Polaribacter sp. Q13 TaxID=2806551 RepID=UPI00193BBC38|nr:CPBP family intramembrane glutamic endopeptidase [Polaribacter sp. Q13]QVY66859.1 CPBP family intramembrane metalloprotease [Polaribacter sp. Q13]
MNKITLRNTLIPLFTLAFICFMYFGPITRTPFENIIISIIIIIANYIEYKGKPFSMLGFKREKFNAKNLLVYAPLVALGLFIFYVFAVVPGIEILTGVTIDYSSMSQLKGNLGNTIIWLLIVWVTAGFGEEIIFRGYLMRQFVKFFGDSKISLAINILIICGFFGYMHMQQGITGQLVVVIIGALLSIIFYIRKYDLWFLIMIHGFFNTLGILSFYFGLA